MCLTQMKSLSGSMCSPPLIPSGCQSPPNTPLPLIHSQRLTAGGSSLPPLPPGSPEEPWTGVLSGGGQHPLYCPWWVEVSLDTLIQTMEMSCLTAPLSQHVTLLVQVPNHHEALCTLSLLFKCVLKLSISVFSVKTFYISIYFLLNFLRFYLFSVLKINFWIEFSK